MPLFRHALKQTIGCLVALMYTTLRVGRGGLRRSAPVLLSLLLLLSGISAWPAATAVALAAQTPPPAKGITSYKQFLQLGRDSKYHGPLKQQLTAAPSPAVAASRNTTQPKALPSVEPAKMKPIRLPLSASVLAANQTGAATSQLGSDSRLEIQVAPGSLDATTAKLATGATPAGISTGGLTLQVSQRSGHATGVSSVLGTYQFQILDSQGKAVQGMTARKPVTWIYHYQPGELQSLGIDPARVWLTWPAQTAAARAAKQSTAPYAVLMTNDAKNHTLTAQTSVLSPGVVTLSSVPLQQSPPKPHLASVEGNSGNLTYSYPIQMPPGPGGFVPPIAFNYSSADPNERHSPLSPADNLGDGWSLGLGSVTAEVYPSTSAGGTAIWYFLNGPDGKGDRLVPDPNNVGSFYTEHLSRNKIVGQGISSTNPTLTCFHMWDTSGTYYEFGCTPDSVQYLIDSSNTKSTYRWDLDLIVPAREGPNAAERQVKISYFQDIEKDTTGFPSVRDAVPAQIVYQTLATPTSTTPTVVGTLDFQYRAPGPPTTVPSGASASWVTPYGKNYNCQDTNGNPVTPPGDTTLRCDDPIDVNNSIKAPAVMSTYSLQKITVYVGADTANPPHPAYGYSFNYQDNPFVSLTNPLTLQTEFAAGEHLLTNITPSVYLGGTAHNLPEVAFTYTPLQDSYYDGEETASNGTTQYAVTTNWQYLHFYQDQNTNIGETITYQTAFSNTHGTPFVTDSNGNITDDRHDPFYCTTHANDSDTSKQCRGNYANPQDHTWSVQVVRVRESLGKDSGDPNLQHATYFYTYTLGAWGTYQTDFGGKGTFCSPGSSSPPAGENDCVFDTFIVGPTTGGQDGGWVGR